MKYSRTARPPLKFALFGRSMMSPLRVGHEAGHPGELADLLERAARSRVGHHEDGVQLVHRLGHGVRDGVGRLRPLLDDSLLALVLGDEAPLVVALDPLHALLVAAE